MTPSLQKALRESTEWLKMAELSVDKRDVNTERKLWQCVHALFECARDVQGNEPEERKLAREVAAMCRREASNLKKGML